MKKGSRRVAMVLPNEVDDKILDSFSALPKEGQVTRATVIAFLAEHYLPLTKERVEEMTKAA